MPNKTPHPLIAVIPIVALIAMLAVVLTIFNSDAISGGSQVALIFASAVCIADFRFCSVHHHRHGEIQGEMERF